MKRLLALPLLLAGCATATFMPGLPNVKMYQNCIPVYSEHKPVTVALLEQQVKYAKTLKDTLKDNPTLFDKVFPSPTTVSTLGKAAIPLGNAATGIAGAFTDMAPSALMANIIGGVVVQGITALGAIRSESSDQYRVDVCSPITAKTFNYYRKTSEDEVKIVIDNSEQTQPVVK